MNLSQKRAIKWEKSNRNVNKVKMFYGSCFAISYEEFIFQVKTRLTKVHQEHPCNFFIENN